MIDLKLLEKDFESVSKGLRKKGVDESLLEELKLFSSEVKSKKQVFETLQADQNAKSKLFPIYKKEGKDINDLKKELDENKKKIALALEKQRKALEKLENLALKIPNLPDEDVAEGENEEENIEIKRVLDIPNFSFTPKEHWDLAGNGNLIDFERGVKLSKSRFVVLNEQISKLNRALINYMLDFNSKRGFTEVSVPQIVNRESLLSTGQLPKFEDDLFKISDEELFLIPTAEVPLTNLYRDEILNESELPIKHTSYTACFRKEAGSAGRDTRGIIRQHQFDKVELVAITKPQQSEQIFNEMVECASDLLTSLELPHRLVSLCGGDLGFSASKTIDLEVWLPGQNRYREISSVSNTKEFQARRAKIRYKDGKKNILTHTLNGSSLAVGRTIVAIMENFQKENGTFEIPKVLQKYYSLN
jgi:seryl-tRNA synthetase